MRLLHVCLLQIGLLLLSACSAEITGKEYFIESKQAYYKVVSKLQAGDTVILKDGTWTDFEILFEGQGEKNAPIELRAETKGQVILSGQSNLRLAGQHLLVTGLVFKNGFTPSSAVIEFRRDKSALAYHSQVSEVVIDNYNNPDKTEPDYWVALYGQHNRFDHNHIVGKRNKGVTVAVRLDSEQSQQNHHIIDHNYFGYRPTFGSNGGETLRIGTSHYSLTDSYTLVENNYFEQTNGEVEIISIKSGKNTVRGNVFFEARGTLTMRHGNGNIIEENVFLGNGVDHTGGIRVINRDQVIRNNYLEGLTGYRFGSGFTIMNGVPNSAINRYHQVANATIEHNTFVNVEHIQLAAGSDVERSAVPIDSVMKNNLFINQDNQQPFTLFDDVSGIKFTENVANTKAITALSYGIKHQDVALTRSNNGLLYPTSKAVTAGVKQDLKFVTKEATGVAWYPKVPAIIAFDSGQTHVVSATAESLLSAIEQAKDGDVVELASGQYDIPKLVKIDKTITLKAQQAGTAKLTFERSALFEINDGGSLKLDGLVISGENSPDSTGNSAIRTKKWGMVDNYRFVLTNSTVSNLNVNHSFHFFSTGKGAFADQIVLSNNKFDNITGDILQLDSEIEDLGVYNAEYVTLKDNQFSKVEGAVLKLYRGGTDESTFGPHLSMANNQLSDVGLGKRNKSKASLYLHGVQVSNIEKNTLLNSAPILIEHTVGEPKTAIFDNSFEASAAPKVVELHFKGPHTALLENNHVD